LRSGRLATCTTTDNYYGFAGPYAEALVSSLPASPAEISRLIQAFTNIGADEVVLWPTIAELDQLDRLAQIVG
jgi:hypothetical protein